MNGKRQVVLHPETDGVLTLDEKSASEYTTDNKKPATIAMEVTSPIPFQHRQHNVNDFRRQSLMVNPMSFSGPCMVTGDVNGDGLDDVYVGRGDTQQGVLFMQRPDGKFAAKELIDADIHAGAYDTDAAFFDANGDGNLDLYVCSGGYHDFAAEDLLLQDRLYLNDGRGNLVRKKEALPQMPTSSSCVRVNDIDRDGHLDLFIGGRVIPGRYPEPPRSYMLINDGNGHFVDKTSSIAEPLERIGMVSDALWLDLNDDDQKDLIVVGEWMPLTVFIHTDGTFVEKTSDYFDKTYSGWWNKIHTADFNHDGQMDLVVGNHGLNSQCKVSDQEPAALVYKDFDNNGSVDPMLCFYIQGKRYPYVSRDELIEQLGMMRARFPDYRSYADAELENVFTESELKDTGSLSVNFLETACFIRDSLRFTRSTLPIQAQFSPVYTITSLDFNNDGDEDLLLCGNMNHARLRFGKYDANYGTLLEGDGKGGFSYVPQSESGFKLKGDVRSVVALQDVLLVGINQKPIQAFHIKPKGKRQVPKNF
jgi:hypothetical protein